MLKNNDGNIITITTKDNIKKKAVLAGLVIANMLTVSGCAKNMLCNISENHAHYYVDDEGFARYIPGKKTDNYYVEKSSVAGLNRTEDYVYVNEETAEILKFINKEGLFSIDANQQAISNIVDNQQDFIEYEYNYFYYRYEPVYIYSNGTPKIAYYRAVPVYATSWTTDTNGDLTGNERVCHYVYYGYKIIKNEKGKYEAVKSNPVDDLYELPGEYKYVKKEFCDVEYLYDMKSVLTGKNSSEKVKIRN